MFVRIGAAVAVSASIAISAGGIAHAAPTLVDPWNSSGNGNYTGNNYGTVPNMDLIYRGLDAFGDATQTGNAKVWALWGTLYHVSYSDVQIADIFLSPDAGWLDGVSLYSFDIGSYYGDPRTSEVRVYDGDYSNILFQHIYDLGDSAVTIAPNLSSLNGLHIQISGDPGWVAFDNLLVEGGDVFSGQVPEPATWAMMILGFGGVGATLRQRRRLVATA